MIRLRCDTGRRQSQPLDERRVHGTDWIEMARVCACLQAQTVIGTGRKRVPLPAIAEQDWAETPRSLYESGMVELLAWDDDVAGGLRRIRSVDLSYAAARTLLQAGHLPHCFLTALVAHDLLVGHMPLMEVTDADLLSQEFAAWFECGGLSAASSRNRQRISQSSSR